jgi:hypothetical protein
MGFKNCCTCGISFDSLQKQHKDYVIYCDGGALEISHGGGQCRECYSITHSFCKNCPNTPLMPTWNFCPWCGEKVERNKNN